MTKLPFIYIWPMFVLLGCFKAASPGSVDTEMETDTIPELASDNEDTETSTDLFSRYPPMLNAIYGVSSDDIYAVGNRGAVVHFDGTSWGEIDFDEHLQFESVWGADANNIYIAGYEYVPKPHISEDECDDLWSYLDGCYVHLGVVYKFDGVAWVRSLEMPANSTFNLIHGASDNKIMVKVRDLNEGRDRVHLFNGDDWSVIETGDEKTDWMKIRDLWTTDSKTWLFRDNMYGLDGESKCLIEWFDGVNTNQICPDDFFLCSSSWMDQSGDFFIVGSDIVHSDGVSCSLEEFPEITGSLNAVWGRSVDNVYVVGDNGIVLHRSGGVWTKIEVPAEMAGASLIDVWMSDNTTYVVGNRKDDSSEESSWIPFIAAYRDGSWNIEYEGI